MTVLDARVLGGRVRDTRKRKGVTQEELARLVNVDRTVINKIEAGSRKVAALELSDIANALGVQMMTFFQEPTPAVVAHRSSQGLDTAESKIDAILADIATDVEFVQSLTPLSPGVIPEAYEPPQSVTDAEAMAVRARRLLDVEPGAPILDLGRRVEKLGLFVFARDLGVDTADAGTVLLNEGGVSLVNSANKVGRRRLAVAHELGHFLVADQYTVDWRVVTDEVPREARFDRFARALLLPMEAINTEWTRLTENSETRVAAVKLASMFQVDMSTLSRRLLDLSLVDASIAGDVRAARTTQSDMIEFDLHPGDEFAGLVQPRSYQRAVLKLVKEQRISRERGQALLWGLVAEEDMPFPRRREENEIWKFVS
ncbi:MAG: helix-turn-helix domain-containing protein [Tessaracoccus sp.]